MGTENSHAALKVPILFPRSASPNTFPGITSCSRIQIQFFDVMRYLLATASNALDDVDDLRPLKQLGGGVSGEVYLVFPLLYRLLM